MFDTKGWRLFQRVESDQQARRLDCRSFGTHKDAVSGFWAPFQRFAVMRDDQLELVADRMLVLSADTLHSFDEVGQIRMRLRVGRKVWARVLEKTDAREGSKATDELLQRLKEGFLAKRATDCGPVRNEHEIPCEDPVMGKVVQAFATFNPRHGFYGKIVKATSIVDIQLELHDEDMTLSENALHMSSRWLAHFAGLAGRIPYLSRKVVQARLKKIGERYLNDELLRRIDKEFFRPWYAENAASSPASGMVLYGPVGTGKSEIINQFCEPEDGGDPDGKMSAMGFYVIRVTGAASLLKPYSGQTQELMRMLAEEALKRPHQMCVLALDEYEAIAEDRDLVKQDYKAGYVGQLLAIIGQRKYPNLCVWAATNFFSKIDVALLREGRQEAHFLLGPLSAQEAFATAKNVLSRPPAQKAVQSWTQAHENSTLDDLCWLIVPHALNFTVSQLVRVLAQAVDFWTFEAESGKIQDLSFLIAQEFRKKLSMRCPENLRFNKLVSSTLTSIPRETLVGLYSHISRCRSRGRIFLNPQLGMLSVEGSMVPYFAFPPAHSQPVLHHLPFLLGRREGKYCTSQVVLFDASFYERHQEESAFQVFSLLADECKQLQPALVVVDVVPLIGWQLSQASIGENHSLAKAKNWSTSRATALGITHGRNTNRQHTFGTSTTLNEGWNRSFSVAQNESLSVNGGISFGSTLSQSSGDSLSVGDAYSHGFNTSTNTGTSQGASRTASDSSGASAGASIGGGSGSSRNFNNNWNQSVGGSWNDSVNQGQTFGENAGFNRSYNVATNANASRSYNAAQNSGHSKSFGVTGTRADAKSGGAAFGSNSSESFSDGKSESASFTGTVTFQDGSADTQTDGTSTSLTFQVTRGRMLQALIHFARNEDRPYLAFICSDPFLQRWLMTEVNFDGAFADPEVSDMDAVRDCIARGRSSKGQSEIKAFPAFPMQEAEFRNRLSARNQSTPLVDLTQVTAKNPSSVWNVLAKSSVSASVKSIICSMVPQHDEVNLLQFKSIVCLDLRALDPKDLTQFFRKNFCPLRLASLRLVWLPERCDFSEQTAKEITVIPGSSVAFVQSTREIWLILAPSSRSLRAGDAVRDVCSVQFLQQHKNDDMKEIVEAVSPTVRVVFEKESTTFGEVRLAVQQFLGTWDATFDVWNDFEGSEEEKHVRLVLSKEPDKRIAPREAEKCTSGNLFLYKGHLFYEQDDK